MKKNTKSKMLQATIIAGVVLALALLIYKIVPQRQSQVQTTNSFTQWNDCESLTALQSYVDVVTDPDESDYIPIVDRVAVFDLDGTLVGEQFPIYFEWMMYCQRVLSDDTYIPTEEQLELAEEILEAARARSIPEGIEKREHIAFGEVFAGMSNADFRHYVQEFLQTDADGFEGLKLADAYFRPMVEVVEFLKANDFTVYVVSGTDRDCDRVMITDVLDLPKRQIIGSDYYSKASGQDDKAYLDYQFTAEDTVIRGGQSIIKNVKMSKVMQMEQELGQQPVLAFGNSSGDKSMLIYTTSNNTYRAAAFCLVPDDNEREYAYPEKVESLKEMCAENGWYLVSMKDDFKTIYGDGVQKQENNFAWTDKMNEQLDIAI